MMLLPLIEFEFSFMSSDAPELLQSPKNIILLRTMFRICRAHGWTNFDSLKTKKCNPYFRLNSKGLGYILKIAGPFISEERNEWAKLILERTGVRGGYQIGKPPTELRVKQVMKRYPEKEWSVKELCLKLRLTTGSIRAAMRRLQKQKQASRYKKGKVVTWKLL